MTINELAYKFYEDFKDEKLKGSLEEFVKLAFRTGYMTGHMVGLSKQRDRIEELTLELNKRSGDQFGR